MRLQTIFKFTLYLEGILECYYCQENGGEEHDVCTSDEIGSPVECQTNDPDGKHYGDVCAVGHAGKQLMAKST